MDWASTSPMSQAALDSWRNTARAFPGNPSSMHREGKAAASFLQEQRSKAAALLGARPEQLFFTSGGTESNALVLSKLLSGRKGSLLIPDFEHPAVYEYREPFLKSGFQVIPYTIQDGMLFDPDAFAAAISGETRLVCCMTIHNETGAIFPVDEIARQVRGKAEKSGKPLHLHTDAVQAGGKIDLNLTGMGVDSASFSGHKLMGPRGVGILYLKNPQLIKSPGGGQEGGVRPGTENLPAIASMVTALEEYISCRDTLAERGKTLFEALSGQKGVRILPETRVKHPDRFIPSIISFSAAPIPSEVLVRTLDDKGFAISSGSACSSKKVKGKRRAIIASGVKEFEAQGAVRVSIGPGTGEGAIQAFMAALDEALEELGRAYG